MKGETANRNSRIGRRHISTIRVILAGSGRRGFGKPGKGSKIPPGAKEVFTTGEKRWRSTLFSPAFSAMPLFESALRPSDSSP